MWVEFVAGSSLLREGFLRVLRFSLRLKNQHFQIPIRSGLLSALCHEPLARVIALAHPVFDMKFAFTFFFYSISMLRLFISQDSS